MNPTFRRTVKGTSVSTRITKEQCTARSEALEEAAGHLDLEWTVDKLEREQGSIVSEQLRKEAAQWRVKAAGKRCTTMPNTFGYDVNQPAPIL